MGLFAENFLLLNGDTYVEAPLGPLLTATAGSSMVLSLVWVPNTARYGRVEVKGNRVVRLHEKGDSGQGLINAGVYGLTRDVVSRLPEGPSSLERDLLEPLVASESPLFELAGDVFFDIGVVADYIAAGHYLLGE